MLSRLCQLETSDTTAESLTTAFASAPPRAAPQFSTRCANPSVDGLIVWMLLALSTIEFRAFSGIRHFGVVGTLEKAAPSPVVRALAAVAHLDLAASGQGYVARVEWATVGNAASLRVPDRRRPAGVDPTGRPGQTWAEVLRLAPDADRPGMRINS